MATREWQAQCPWMKSHAERKDHHGSFRVVWIRPHDVMHSCVEISFLAKTSFIMFMRTFDRSSKFQDLVIISEKMTSYHNCHCLKRINKFYVNLFCLQCDLYAKPLVYAGILNFYDKSLESCNKCKLLGLTIQNVYFTHVTSNMTY